MSVVPCGVMEHKVMDDDVTSRCGFIWWLVVS